LSAPKDKDKKKADEEAKNEAAYEAAMKKAETAMKAKKYAEAMKAYGEALKIKRPSLSEGRHGGPSDDGGTGSRERKESGSPGGEPRVGST